MPSGPQWEAPQGCKSLSLSASFALLPQAIKTGVELIMDVDPAAHNATLVGDAFRLRQVIVNLTDNALKARDVVSLASRRLRVQALLCGAV